MRSDRQSKAPIKILQFTDTHLFAGEDGRLVGVATYASLRNVIDLALAERGKPDLILLTGDLSQDETPESYERLRELIGTIGSPAYCLPGNHDTPALMTEVLAVQGSAIRNDCSFVCNNWQVILLSSHWPGHVEGLLNESELERLEDALALPSYEHALVCLHHNPVSVNCAWMDKISLTNPEALFSILDAESRVRALLWGHVHQEFEGERRGIKLMSTPSTCVQFQPGGANFAVDDRPPGYRWLELHSDGTIGTAVGRLPSTPEGLILASRGY
jgi:Icc protein